MAKRSYVESAARALYATAKDMDEREAGKAVERLAAILKEDGRLDLLPKIADAYAKLGAEDIVTITTAAGLDEDAVTMIRKALGDDTVFEVAPSLIAGAVIRHGDTLLDASAKRSLELLKIAMTA